LSTRLDKHIPSVSAYYETLQDKLTQLKDAREALDALRAEHYERKQQEAFERDRQRQIQLAEKLDFMRQKKQVSEAVILRLVNM
jgi:growth factor-regulated tyrosine kinase substrate